MHRFTRPSADLGVDTLGLHFDTPFGVAAGFDKDGEAVIGLGALGFGHVEVGTLTATPSPGNPTAAAVPADPRPCRRSTGWASTTAERRPRAAGSRRLRARPRPPGARRQHRQEPGGRRRRRHRRLPRERPAARPARRLPRGQRELTEHPGLRGLQELDKLAPLLTAVQDASRDTTPLLVKIAPDLTDDEVRRIAELAVELGLDGIIATNTTIARDGLTHRRAAVEAAGAGGLSGAPLAARSLEVLRLIRAAVPAEPLRHLGRRRRNRATTSPNGSRPARPWCRATRRSCTAARSGRARSTAGWLLRERRRRLPTGWPLPGQAGHCPRLTCGFGRRRTRSCSARIAAYQRHPLDRVLTELRCELLLHGEAER